LDGFQIVAGTKGSSGSAKDNTANAICIRADVFYMAAQFQEQSQI
jgi:hypothetical protein